MSTSAEHQQTLAILGMALFSIGVVAAIADVLPLVTSWTPLPVAFYLLALLAPLGIALMLGSLWQGARKRSRQTRLTASSRTTDQA
ncbi:MAG TPA: hypothetical protein VMT88_00010 [Actinomycetes bacterium]|nr:hypothetical protein [Actinomycetes bacterium]